MAVVLLETDVRKSKAPFVSEALPEGSILRDHGRVGFLDHSTGNTLFLTHKRARHGR